VTVKDEKTDEIKLGDVQCACYPGCCVTSQNLMIAASDLGSRTNLDVG
jgi:hypothetical protein